MAASKEAVMHHALDKEKKDDCQEDCEQELPHSKRGWIWFWFPIAHGAGCCDITVTELARCGGQDCLPKSFQESHSVGIRRPRRGQASLSRNKFVPGISQGVYGFSRELLLDQHIIRVIGRDDEDGDAIARNWLDEGEQDSGLGESGRAFEFQADPVVQRVYVRRKIVGRADDGEFVGGSGDRGEDAPCGPLGNVRVGGEAHNRIRATGKPAEFELVATFHYEVTLIAICTALNSAPPTLSTVGWQPFLPQRCAELSRLLRRSYLRPPSTSSRRDSPFACG